MGNENKTAQQRAQEKFKRVGTKLNEQEQAKFNEILAREGLNQSQYIKRLIFEDRHTNYEVIQNEMIVKRSNEIEELKKENDALKKEIAEIEELGFWDIVKLRFF